MKIAMPVKDWPLIDATIDNTVAIAAQNGEATTAAHGHAIRENGWEVARNHAKAGQGPVGWPPEDEELSLDLTAESWQFIVEQLRRWDKVDYLMNSRSEGDAESRKQTLSRKLEERVS